MDDPLLAWHEAFVAAGYEVESLITNDITRDFAAFGTLDRHRLVLWRGFNDAVNILVESEAAPHQPLVRTWQKLPSGGSTSYGWLGDKRWKAAWRYGDFVRNHVGFMQVLTAVRAVIRGNVTVDDDDDRRHFMEERLKVANAIFMQRRYLPPESWVIAPGRTPESPRRT